MVGIQPPRTPLDLSKDDHRYLRRLARDLRDEIVSHYEDYLIRDRRNISNRWAFVRSEGDVIAFREGKLEIEQRNAHASPRQPQAWMAARSSLPRLKVVGMIPGTLDDAMFAHAVHDSTSLRTFSRYQREGVTQCAVLNVVDAPTEEEPFAFCGVTWFLKTFPTYLVSDREALTLTYSHVGHLSNGEQYGVVINHSIVHDDLPASMNESLVRAEASIARVFRQATDSHVEVFVVEFVDAKGVMPEAFQIHEQAKLLLSVRRSIDTALNMKLCGRLAHRSRQRPDSIAYLDCKARSCEVCRRGLGGIFASGGHRCQLCDKEVCGRCVNKRELVIDATETRAIVKPFEFCVSCILATQAVPSIDVARSVVRARAGQYNLPPMTPSSSGWRTSSRLR